MLTKENAQKLFSDYHYLIGKTLEGNKIYDLEILNNEGTNKYYVIVLVNLPARARLRTHASANIFYALDKLGIDVDYNKYGI